MTPVAIAANILAWPKEVFVGKPLEAPLWTTKYLFAEHYSVHTPASKRLCKEIDAAAWAIKWQTVRKVVWAATIVLPIIDAVSWTLKQLARLDASCAELYDLQKRRQEVYLEERKLEALGESVREFAGYLLLVGCKKEVDEGHSLEDITRMRQDSYRHFCTHFKEGALKDALLVSTRQILALIHSSLKADSSLKAEFVRAFELIEKRMQENESTEWLMGLRNESLLYASWELLVEQHDEFYKLCQST